MTKRERIPLCEASLSRRIGGVKAAGEGRLERQLESFYGIKETMNYPAFEPLWKRKPGVVEGQPPLLQNKAGVSEATPGRNNLY